MQDPHSDDHRSVLHKKRWQELLGGNHILKRILRAEFPHRFDLLSPLPRSEDAGSGGGIEAPAT